MGSVPAEVSRGTGAESGVCPGKGLASEVQEGAICVQKCGQHAAMVIPEQAINHHREGHRPGARTLTQEFWELTVEKKGGISQNKARVQLTD